MDIYQNTAFTVDTLAARWMCSRDVIYDMVRKGKIKAFKIGSAWRISADAVSRFENNE